MKIVKYLTIYSILHIIYNNMQLIKYIKQSIYNIYHTYIVNVIYNTLILSIVL